LFNWQDKPPQDLATLEGEEEILMYEYLAVLPLPTKADKEPHDKSCLLQPKNGFSLCLLLTKKLLCKWKGKWTRAGAGAGAGTGTRVCNVSKVKNSQHCIAIECNRFLSKLKNRDSNL
jgi:hypothetical protein